MDPIARSSCFLSFSTAPFEMYQQALKGSEKSLGPNHQSTLSVAQRLGEFYEKEGNLRRAEEMYQRELHWKWPLSWYKES